MKQRRHLHQRKVPLPSDTIGSDTMCQLTRETFLAVLDDYALIRRLNLLAGEIVDGIVSLYRLYILDSRRGRH